MTLSEKNQIYDLLKQVTSVIEEVQRQTPETDKGDRTWNQLQSLIHSVDELYHDVEDFYEYNNS